VQILFAAVGLPGLVVELRKTSPSISLKTLYTNSSGFVSFVADSTNPFHSGDAVQIIVTDPSGGYYTTPLAFSLTNSYISKTITMNKYFVITMTVQNSINNPLQNIKAELLDLSANVLSTIYTSSSGIATFVSTALNFFGPPT